MTGHGHDLSIADFLFSCVKPESEAINLCGTRIWDSG
jgi:hypothetical protein